MTACIQGACSRQASVLRVMNLSQIAWIACVLPGRGVCLDERAQACLHPAHAAALAGHAALGAAQLHRLASASISSRSHILHCLLRRVAPAYNVCAMLLQACETLGLWQCKSQIRHPLNTALSVGCRLEYVLGGYGHATDKADMQYGWRDDASLSLYLPCGQETQQQLGAGIASLGSAPCSGSMSVAFIRDLKRQGWQASTAVPQKGKKGKRKVTGTSQVIPQPTTAPAQASLTAQIERDGV